MVNKSYIPERGDIIWITLDPALGHEQKGRRPALVLTEKFYNEKSELVMICPITSTSRTYPFVVPLEGKVKGMILVDQVRGVAWRKRKSERITKVSNETLHEVVEKLKTLIE